MSVPTNSGDREQTDHAGLFDELASQISHSESYCASVDQNNRLLRCLVHTAYLLDDRSLYFLGDLRIGEALMNTLKRKRGLQRCRGY